MKIRVMLMREYDLDLTLADLNLDSVDGITRMDELELIEDEATVTTTWMVEGSVKVVEE